MFRMWSTPSNRLGWSTYLGELSGSTEISPYAVPARRVSLSGLPPAWIGIGTLDLFLNEDVEYARRLRQAGVPCEIEVVPGAFHGFDQLYFAKDVTKSFRNSGIKARTWCL